MVIVILLLLLQQTNQKFDLQECNELSKRFGNYNSFFSPDSRNLLEFSLYISDKPDSLITALKTKAIYFDSKEYLQKCKDSIESTKKLIEKIKPNTKYWVYIYCFQKYERIDEKNNLIYYTAEIKIDGLSDKDELLILRWELENGTWTLKDIYFKNDYTCKDKWR